MGSAGIAGLFAEVVFWGLLLYGLAWDELSPRVAALFVLLWVTARYALPWLLPLGAELSPSVVAILDIVLVFLIFKADVRFP